MTHSLPDCLINNATIGQGSCDSLTRPVPMHPLPLLAVTNPAPVATNVLALVEWANAAWRVDSIRRLGRSRRLQHVECSSWGAYLRFASRISESAHATREFATQGWVPPPLNGSHPWKAGTILRFLR